MALSREVLSKLVHREVPQLEYLAYESFYDNSDIPDDISGRSFIIAKQFMDRPNKKVTSVLQVTNLNKLLRSIKPADYIKKAYVCLDSRYAVFLDRNRRLQWTCVNFVSEFNNATSVINDIKNVVSVRMLSMCVRSFTSPAGRSGIAIDELNAQSIVMPNGRRFHFMGLLNDLTNPVALTVRNSKKGAATPDVNVYRKYELLAGYKFNEGFYHFNKPITKIDTLTISISDPFELITIPKYEFFRVQLANVTATTFDLIFDEPHYYDTFDIFSLFIDEFTTSDTVTDENFINWVNQQEHLLATYIDANTLRVNYVTAKIAGNLFASVVLKILPAMTIPPVGDLSRCRVRINSQRVIMNFEFHYLESDLENDLE